jgi:hypothetical protein
MGEAPFFQFDSNRLIHYWETDEEGIEIPGFNKGIFLSGEVHDHESLFL